MYYNRILRVWVFDATDYFLISAFIGSIIASQLKEYLDEKKAIERLKNSIIKESKLVYPPHRSLFNSKKMKIKKIYKLALETRGGQLDDFEAVVYTEGFRLALSIKGIVERLALFLKQKELKGLCRIFFKGGRVILQLILSKCDIDLNYALIGEGLSTQMIVMTVTLGGSAGFMISWLSAGASLVLPPLILSMIFVRSLAQQVANQKDYRNFKVVLTKLLEDEELQKTLKVVFMEGEVPEIKMLEMKPFDPEKHPLPEFNFDLQSDQTPEEFIKARMEEKFGLVENPTSEQLEDIIDHKKVKKKPKGKTVYFKDFIDKVGENPENIIEAEIVQEPLKVKVKNDEL